jgi:hypothetical protein
MAAGIAQVLFGVFLIVCLMSVAAVIFAGKKLGSRCIMKTAARVAVAITTLGLFGGCTNVGSRMVPPSGDQNPLAGYRKFTFLPDPGDAAPAEKTLILGKSITGELQARGYRPVQRSAAPDFLVTCYVNVIDPIDPPAAGYSAARWRAESNPIEEITSSARTPGTDPAWEIGRRHDPHGYVGMSIVIDAIDAQTNELVWRGWARRREELQDVSLEELAEAARKVLEEFPRPAPPQSDT